MEKEVRLGEIIPDFCPEPLSDLHVGYFKDGVLQIEGSVALYYFERYRDAQKKIIENKQAFETESACVALVSKHLKETGWLVELEAYTSQGRIDILAKKNGETQIIEAKREATSHDAARALGQLLFYAKFHPGASLWFYSPERPDETILSILASYGVSYYEF